MKALSLWQPYASLIAIGAKSIETRSWATSYRGPLAILASKKWNAEIAADCRRAADFLGDKGFEPPTDRQRETGFVPYRKTLGCILACCELVECRAMATPPLDLPLDAEFGNFGPGRFGWVLRNVIPVLPRSPTRADKGCLKFQPRS